MTTTLQNHIHLDTTLLTTGDFSPVLKWKAVRRTPDIQVFATYRRSITGKLQFQVAPSGTGTATQFTNFEYALKILPSELATLAAMLGKQVYLVDHYHVADDEDHSTYIRTMYFAALGNIKPPMDHSEVFYVVTISLVDADTIT